MTMAAAQQQGTQPMSESDQIAAFLGNATVEVTPTQASKVDDFRALLAEGTTVFVTFLPGSDIADTIKTVVKLRQNGMNPVPHLAARSIPSRTFLEEALKQFQGDAAVSEALLIGGGVDNPVGEYHSTIQILQTDLLQKYGITRIGVAGHPEGSPDIPEADIAMALAQKNAFAKETGLDMYITTQFCFEAEPVIAWDKRIRAQGNELPIHIGVPGLATVKTLLKHAMACGIGNSMNFLKKQAMNVTKLMTVNAPDRLVRELAAYHANDPECGIEVAHMYPLGGLKKTAAWTRAVQDGKFDLKAKGGFDVTVPIE